MRLCANVLICLALGLISVHASAAPPPHWSVGFHRMTFLDPLDHKPMRALAFYPSNQGEEVTQVEGYKLAASEDARIAMGRYPMLMLSHGNAGTPLALHDLMTSLARKGFIVVAVYHPGDNFRDHSRLGAVSNLYGRPLQISQAITSALAEPMLSPYIDPDRIGVIGYSAGGETALILSGAQPSFDRLRKYCAEFPKDLDACKTHGEMVVDRADLHAAADPRVKSLLLMAPLALMFNRQTLSQVHVPTLIYSGDSDKLLALDKNAAALARKLPVVTDYKLLAGAGHFVFMAPCDDHQMFAMPGLCVDAEGVDRVNIHRDLVRQAGHFFAETLTQPSHAGMQTANQ